jgi:inner membrane protein
LLFGGILAICPDLDYVIFEGALHLHGWHRGLTHSIGFALIVGVLASLAFSSQRIRSALILSLAIASHAFLDLLTGGERVEILWPWSTRRYTLGNLQYYDLSVIAAEPFGRAVTDIVGLCLFEFLIFAPVLFLALYSRRLLRTDPPSQEAS